MSDRLSQFAIVGALAAALYLMFAGPFLVQPEAAATPVSQSAQLDALRARIDAIHVPETSRASIAPAAEDRPPAPVTHDAGAGFVSLPRPLPAVARVAAAPVRAFRARERRPLARVLGRVFGGRR